VSQDNEERSCDNALTQQAVDCNTVNSFKQRGSLETHVSEKMDTIISS